jgi:hypothetical protein
MPESIYKNRVAYIDDKPVFFAVNDKPGAPTTYNPIYCQKLLEWFQSKQVNKEIEINHYKNGEVTFTDKKLIATDFPTFERFAREINTTHRTLQEWCKVHPEFNRAYTCCKEIQKDFLMINGLNNVYNANFAAFVARNITDLKDAPEQAQSGNISINITLPENFRGKVELPGATKSLPEGEFIEPIEE